MSPAPFLVSLALISGCAPPKHRQGESGGASANVLPLAVDLRAVPLRPGLSTVAVRASSRDGDGRDAHERKLIVFAPEPQHQQSARALFVYLHGAGSEAWAAEHLRCLVIPALAELAPIVVAPLSTRAEWWSEAETAYVVGLILGAFEAWPVQRDRLVITGYSNGGIGSWALARLYPKLVSAAIPIASNATVMGDTSVPTYAIHGARDELFGIAGVREKVKELQARGQPVELLVDPRASHMKPCEYQGELQQAASRLPAVWQRASRP